MAALCYEPRPCVYQSLNHHIPSPECVCCSLCEPESTDAGRAGVQPALPPPLVRYKYTIIWYLAVYVNTLILLWFILEYNTNPFWFSHIYTRKVLLPHIVHYHHDPTLSSLCNKTFTWLRFIIDHAWLRLRVCVWTHWNPRTDWLIRDALPRGRVPRPANIYHEVTMTTWTCHF